MQTAERYTLNKKPNYAKLAENGFVARDGGLAFSADITDGAFRLDIFVSDSGKTELKVIDSDSGEEYALAFNANAVGSFVGAVRAECEQILGDIVEKCFEPDIFKSEYARLVIDRIWAKYGARAEYLWEKFPNNAVFREASTNKWFAALLTVERHKLGIDGGGSVEIIDLKAAPEQVAELVDGKRYLAGYHMNKKHWYTICLDGSVPIEEIYSCIDNSYSTVFG